MKSVIKNTIAIISIAFAAVPAFASDEPFIEGGPGAQCVKVFIFDSTLTCPIPNPDFKG